MTQNPPDTFRAFRIHDNDGAYHAAVESVSLQDLEAGDVTIRVEYSSINYKDALAGTGKGKILRRFPMNGGIDVAGTVVSSESERFQTGDQVLVTGAGLSETRDGGYSEYLRLDSQWVLPLPQGLSLRESMVLGTAGFTAALSLHRMEISGQKPADGPILVTGASGGVGSIAVDLLATAGYEVHAVSGKPEQFDWLKSLGASACMARDELAPGKRPLESARWAGCIDSVGGAMLSGICAQIRPWGNIASCGLAGGINLNTTVLPFIIRGVSLIGIDSPTCPYPIREVIWQKLSAAWKPRHLAEIGKHEVGLEGLHERFETMLAGQSLGRTVVRIGNSG